MIWVILILTPNGATRCQFWKLAMFGIKLKGLKKFSIFNDLNEAYLSQTFTPPLNGVNLYLKPYLISN